MYVDIAASVPHIFPCHNFTCDRNPYTALGRSLCIVEF